MPAARQKPGDLAHLGDRSEGNVGRRLWSQRLRCHRASDQGICRALLLRATALKPVLPRAMRGEFPRAAAV